MRNHLIPLVGALLWAGAIAAAEEERVLPRNMTILEQLSAQEDVNAPGYYIWECFPELAGFTDPPPETSRFPTEGEQTRGVMYGWPSYGGQMSPLTELIRNSVAQDGYETTVIVPSTYRGVAEATLRARGFDDDMISRINWFIAPLNGIWLRDYGPEILVTENGDFQFVDMGYYSGQFTTCPSTPEGIAVGRPSDDVSPTRFAPSFLKTGVDVFRPQLRTEGGNLQTDGYGTCVHMRRDVLQENNFSRWRYTQDDLDAVYQQFFNCSRVITLNSLASDPDRSVGVGTNIDHVDMIVSFVSPQTVIVGYMYDEDASFDPTNAAILDSNAQLLSDAGYNVVRVPMPSRYCTVHHTNTCVANPNETRECGAGVDRVWATYTNSILIGSRMLVPVFQDPYSDSSPLPQDVKDRIQMQEAEALGTYQATLDAEYGQGAITVVPVVSDDMIPCLGSMHCISMTYGPPPQ